MVVLVVVDMQHDFVDGALGTPEAQEVVAKVTERVKKYTEDPEAIIIYTRDTHYSNYLDTLEGQNLPMPHCIYGTKGWEIVPEVFVDNGRTFVVDKTTFGHANLAKDICTFVKQINSNFDETDIFAIELCGVCTDICVVSNALMLKANFTELPIRIDKDCCAGTTPENHQAALRVMSNCQIEII